MMPSDNAPAPIFSHLLTGRYTEDQTYSSYRERGTTDWLLIHTLAGCGRVGWKGGSVLAPGGCSVLLRPGTRHDYGTAAGWTSWELYWVHFYPSSSMEGLLTWPEAAPGVMRLDLRGAAAHEPATAALAEMHRFATGGLRRRERFALAALETALLWHDTANPLSEASRLDPRIQAALDFLFAHLADKITVAGLAEAACASVSRFAHLFRAQTGMSPLQYLEMQRIQRAKKLLGSTRRTVQAIAAEVGFENQFYFSMRFRKLTGLSPTEFRRQEQGDGEE